MNILEKNRHTVAFVAATLLMAILSVSNVSAQTWAQCTDGSSISRCETYDCPQGDTNNDGSCSLDDTDSRLTDVRNDSFCANPISGCGEVRYYGSNSSDACSVRVEQTGNNCNLYTVGSPTFTPVPTGTPQPTATQSGGQAFCSGLLLSKTEGELPLKVDMEVKASGNVSKISEYEFIITKPSGQKETVSQASSKLSKTFSTEGDYKIESRLVDFSGQKHTSSFCKKEVVVNESLGRGGAVNGKTTKGGEELPETGPELYLGAFLIATGAAGVFLYEKFRIL